MNLKWSFTKAFLAFALRLEAIKETGRGKEDLEQGDSWEWSKGSFVRDLGGMILRFGCGKGNFARWKMNGETS